jgi:hypothetical protein
VPNLIVMPTSHRLVIQGGTIIVWKSSRFTGQVIFQNEFVMTVEFASTYSNAVWLLTNVYAPCTTEGRQEFIN